MNIVTQLLALLGQLLTGFLGLVTDAFDGVVGIFWTSGEDGGFTIYGIFLLIGFVIGMIFVAFNVIRSLVRARGQFLKGWDLLPPCFIFQKGGVKLVDTFKNIFDIIGSLWLDLFEGLLASNLGSTLEPVLSKQINIYLFSDNLIFGGFTFQQAIIFVLTLLTLLLVLKLIWKIIKMPFKVFGGWY